MKEDTNPYRSSEVSAEETPPRNPNSSPSVFLPLWMIGTAVATAGIFVCLTDFRPMAAVIVSLVCLPFSLALSSPIAGAFMVVPKFWPRTRLYAGHYLILIEALLAISLIYHQFHFSDGVWRYEFGPNISLAISLLAVVSHASLNKDLAWWWRSLFALWACSTGIATYSIFANQTERWGTEFLGWIALGFCPYLLGLVGEFLRYLLLIEKKRKSRSEDGPTVSLSPERDWFHMLGLVQPVLLVGGYVVCFVIFLVFMLLTGASLGFVD